MTPDVVVDIGNSRMKWWFPGPSDQPARLHRLDPDDTASHSELLLRLGYTKPLHWALASVHPPRTRAFTSWLAGHGHRFKVVEGRRMLDLQVQVDEPDRVGLDRLLNALAAKSIVPEGTPAVLVDIGTAATVDLLDQQGRFAGGAIFPGPELMVRALHDHTAQLPSIDLSKPVGPLPAKNTAAAIHVGVVSSVWGGIVTIIRQLAAQCRAMPEVLITGGGALHLPVDMQDFLDYPVCYEPLLTLQGIRLAVESLP